METERVMQFMLSHFKNALMFLRLTIACLLFSVTSLNADESSPHIVIVTSSDAELYSRIGASVVSKLDQYCRKNRCVNSNHPIIKTISLKQVHEITATSSSELIISLGSKARNRLDALQLADSVQVLHALIPLNSSLITQKHNHYTLVLDQPIEKILKFTWALLEPDKPVGILYSSNSQWRMPAIREASKQSTIEILESRINNQDVRDIGASLKALLPKVSSILILPDKSIYNRSTIAQLLLTGYQNQIPFIGYSKALAKTGALASVTTDKNSIAQDISDLAIKLLTGKEVEPIQFPKRHKLVINKKILESMEIEISPEVMLTDDVEVFE